MSLIREDRLSLKQKKRLPYNSYFTDNKKVSAAYATDTFFAIVKERGS